MAVAAHHDYEDAIMELESSVAILKSTSNTNGGNIRLLRKQIDDVSKALLAFKDKMRNYLPIRRARTRSSCTMGTRRRPEKICA